jgi:hypothetical protein
MLQFQQENLRTLHFLLCRCNAWHRFVQILWRVTRWLGEAVFSIPDLLQWGYVNSSTPNFLIVHRCLPILPILPAVLTFCSMLSHYGRCCPILPDVFPFRQCFPFCSKFSILLGVFSFGWGIQNYEQKFAFMIAASIFAWSNQNPKPKYRFRSIYTTA